MLCQDNILSSQDVMLKSKTVRYIASINMLGGGFRAAMLPRLNFIREHHVLTRPLCTRLHHSHLAYSKHRYKSTKATEEEIDLDKPIQFSTSRAATWKARDSYGSDESEDKMPWYQPYVISGCVVTFLMYFCVLREENEADQNLRKTLYDYIDGIEEQQLKMSLEHNIQMGKDTSAITARLKQIEESQKNKPDLV